MLAPRDRAMPITPETELYDDLGMYGDVLAFDLVWWANHEFGVEPNLRISDYAPGECPSFFRLLAKLARRPKGYYRSLKVRDVVTAIETKRWPK